LTVYNNEFIPSSACIDFCISQGRVATVLRLARQNYSNLRQMSSPCCTPKIIKIDQCFAELFEKYKWFVFLRHGVLTAKYLLRKTQELQRRTVEALLPGLQ